MSLLTIENPRNKQETYFETIPSEPSFVSEVVVSATYDAIKLDLESDVTNVSLIPRPRWHDEEYRQAYMDASVEQGIAWQIKVNRKMRDWSQADLARMLDTQQSAVSRLEDPEYGGHSLDMLVRVAHAFDCALSIKLISYAALARDADQLNKQRLYAAPFNEQAALFEAE